MPAQQRSGALVEDEKGQGEKRDTVASAPDPVASVHPELPPMQGGKAPGEPHGAKDGRQDGQSNARSFLRRLTTNEWLTFLVGAGSLVVSYLTYRNAEDTSDLKAAVGGLTELAAETRRQADTAQAALIASERPWVEVIGLSIVWVEVNKLGVSANFEVGTKNTGRSPALRAFVDARIVLDTKTDEVGSQATAMCDSVARDRDRFGVEGVVFPNIARKMPLLRHIAPDTIGRASRNDRRREGRPFDSRGDDTNVGPASASFAIIGCADYTFASKRGTGQTAFVYDLASNCGPPPQQWPCDFDLATTRTYSGNEIVVRANDFYGFAR